MIPERKIAKLLIQKRKTLAIAESCTGGLLANKITDIPGSSRFFQLGVVVYANQAKMKLLKVPSFFIRKFGSVSPQVAEKMAQGIRQILQSDFGVSITGIAGPSGATKNKPVGLVFIAIDSKTRTLCQKFIFKGPRVAIKLQSATQALKLLLQFLK